MFDYRKIYEYNYSKKLWFVLGWVNKHEQL